MKTIANLSIFIMYFCLYLYITLIIIKMGLFISDINPILSGQDMTLLIHISICTFFVTYVMVLIYSYANLKKRIDMPEPEMTFWSNILIMKPLSGVTVYNYIMNNGKKEAISKMLIRFVHNFRNLFFYASILALSAIFIIKKPSDIILLSFIVCLYFASIFALIFEPLILIDACNRDKKEWEEFNYFEYFTRLKSLIGYSEYYKRHFTLIKQGRKKGND